ncbi:SIR2 family protein [Serratia marcescens]|uniref:SIR2 family protein n=1 Tax=Serratia marcescens TaxID=615 RepID=UPI004036C520
MFNRDIELFIRDYVNDIKAGSAALFAGAGLSIPAGFVSWKELIGDIAYELELDIEKESDLISLAQYHLNEKGNRHKINQKIITEFAEQAEETENHRIIARLPIASLWTTNYDDLIEKTYARYNRVCDVKTTPESLTNNIHKRDVVLYKMHGDYRNPNQAIITREQYETYSRTHLPFINMLMAELTAKTFLFIGFSFEDPNLQYVLSRLYAQYGEGQRNHYCIMRRVQLGDSGSEDQASCDYNSRKQGLMINDLRRYGIQTLLVDDYRQITDLLYAIETQFKKSTVFISGSADNYQPYTREESIQFIHRLARLLIHKQYRIVNGFGWGVGTAVINGALEAIYDSQGKISESQLVLRPFPQFASGGITLPALWHEYRQNMISLSGIAIFLFGNKRNAEGEYVLAEGLLKEFQIATEQGCVCIPIGCTGSASAEIYRKIKEEMKETLYYRNPAAMNLLDQLNEPGSLAEKKKSLLALIDIITKDNPR